MLIAPILLEARRRSDRAVNLFSGNVFNVDASVGLADFCDFLLTHSPFQSVVQAPVFAVVEAKKEDIPAGYGQCVATMVAAQRFNAQNNEPQDTVYGAVNTGDTGKRNVFLLWKFLSLTGAKVAIDRETYYLDRIERLLSVLWHTTR